MGRSSVKSGPKLCQKWAEALSKLSSASGSTSCEQASQNQVSNRMSSGVNSAESRRGVSIR
eukprot:4679912-Pleurochrysis_carterae.AAC.1